MLDSFLECARTVARAVVCLGVAVVAGCGGGGGGSSGTSIGISPGSLQFHAPQGSSVPSKRVHVTFNGDGVLVGYAPGIPQPGWLSASQAGATGNSADFDFSVDGNATPGSYSTSVRFVTGHADGSDLKYVDMPVAYNVTDFGVSPASFSFTAIDGSSAEPAPADQRSFTVSATGLHWTATVDQTWLTLGSTSGSGRATVGFTLNAASLPVGTRTATITVTDSGNGDVAHITVTLQKRSPVLTVTPAPVSFTLNASSTPADLAQALTVTDELGGTDAARTVSWTLDAPSVPWLSVDTTSGTSRPPVTVQASLVQGQLAALPNGTQQTTLTFHYTNAQTSSGTVSVPVTLDLQLPRGEFVAPRVAVSGSTNDVLLRGHGLTGLQASQVLFDGTAATAVTVIDDRQARVTPPSGLGAGVHEIDIANSSGVDLTPAQFVVVTPEVRPYAAFAVTGTPARVLFDSERDTVWVANVTAGSVERYHYDGAAWSALSPLAVTGLRDVVLGLDGHTLLIVALDTIYGLDLDDPAAQPVARFTGNAGAYGFWRGAIAGDDQLVLSSQPPCCSGDFPNFHYDLVSGRVGQFAYPYWDSRALAFASLDGAKVYLSGYTVYRYTAATAVFEPISSDKRVMGVNRDATRLTNQGIVYDESFNDLGHMAATSLFPIFGPGTQRGYGYRMYDDNTTLGQNVIIADLAGTPVNGVYPEVAKVAVPDEPGMGYYDLFYAFSAPLAISADERTLVIRGKNKIVMVPLPAP